MATKKVKVNKLNVPRMIVILLVIYILAYLCYYIYSSPVHHFEITGNDHISDADILRAADLQDYPSFITLSFKGRERKIEELDLVKTAKLSYGWNFTIKITIEENIPVFIRKSTNRVVLADGTEIENTNNIVGIPTLLNETPTEKLKLLASNLAKVKPGILYGVNEIEYSPSYNTSNNKVIDDNRFLLYMNDKNTVYITAKRADILNHYLNVIATNQITGNGTFYLDGDEERYSFIADPSNGAPRPVPTTTSVAVDPNIDDGVAVRE